MTPPPTGQDLVDLLGSFRSLGLDPHKVVDFWFVRYGDKLPSLSAMTDGMIEEQRALVDRLGRDNKARHEFTMYLNGIQAKLKEYGSWEVMKDVKIDINPTTYYRGNVRVNIVRKERQAI